MRIAQSPRTVLTKEMHDNGVAYPLRIPAWVGIEPRGDPLQHRKRIIIERVAIIILYWKRHDSLIKDKIYRILIVRKKLGSPLFQTL